MKYRKCLAMLAVLTLIGLSTAVTPSVRPSHRQVSGSSAETWSVTRTGSEKPPRLISEIPTSESSTTEANLVSGSTPSTSKPTTPSDNTDDDTDEDTDYNDDNGEEPIDDGHDNELKKDATTDPKSGVSKKDEEAGSGDYYGEGDEEYDEEEEDPTLGKPLNIDRDRLRDNINDLLKTLVNNLDATRYHPAHKHLKAGHQEVMNKTEVVKFYETLHEDLKTMGNDILKVMLPIALQAGEEVPDDDLMALTQLFNGVRGLQVWALKFLDASGFLASGFLEGTIDSYGDFDECMNAEAPPDSTGEAAFVGQYCVAETDMPLPPKPEGILKMRDALFDFGNNTEMKGTLFEWMGRYSAVAFVERPKIGICMPHKVKWQNYENLINKILDPIHFRIHIKGRCTSRFDKKPFTKAQTGAIVFFMTIGLMALLSTICDYFMEKDGKSTTTKELLTSFSIFKNTRRLFAPLGNVYGVGDQSGLLASTHGIRVMMGLYCTLLHVYMVATFFFYSFRRMFDGLDLIIYVPFQAIINSQLVLETCFFLTGLVLIYCMLPIIQKTGKFHYHGYIIHRIVRLIPVIGAATALTLLVPRFFSGPFALLYGHYLSDPCENNWWTGFLFVTNYLPSAADMCPLPSWYTSADMQLYLFAPFIIYLIYKSSKWGLIANFTALLVSCIFAPWYILYYKNIPIEPFADVKMWAVLGREVYLATYHHISGYTIGMFTGWCILNRDKIHLGPLTRRVIWIIMPLMGLFSLHYTWRWANVGYFNIDANRLEAAFYLPLHRIMWCLPLGWLVFYCAKWPEASINKFLANEHWVPFSRLTYCFFFTHLNVVFYRMGTLRHALDYNFHNFLWEAAAVWLLTQPIAFLVYVCVEAPFINLEKILIKRQVEKFDEKPKSMPTSMASPEIPTNGAMVHGPPSGRHNIPTVVESASNHLMNSNGKQSQLPTMRQWSSGYQSVHPVDIHIDGINHSLKRPSMDQQLNGASDFISVRL